MGRSAHAGRRCARRRDGFAQTPVVPVTTVAGQPHNQSKLDLNDGEDKPKADKPNAEPPKADKPNAEPPKADKPNAELPKADKPNAEKPKADRPNAEKPDAEAPKADKPGTPRGDKPNPEKFEPAEPKPTTESPNPAQPKRALPGATRAQPNEPGSEPQVDVAKPVSPRPKAAPFVAASPVRHVITAQSPAAERNRTAARRSASAASREWGTSSARSPGGDSADATPVASGPAAVAPRRAPHLASARVAAGGAAPLDRRQPRGLILGGPPRSKRCDAAATRHPVRGRRRPRDQTRGSARARPRDPAPAPCATAGLDHGLRRVGSEDACPDEIQSSAGAADRLPRRPPPFENKQQSRRHSRLPSDRALPASVSRTDND